MVDSMRASLDKATLRRSMRAVRLALPDRPGRSAALWAQVSALAPVGTARRVLVFTSIPGEPETEPFVDWCRASGKEVAAPEGDADPSWPDVVVVPGLAFTAHGDRLGQGGGWYDRFLAGIRDDCTTIGVCFDPQILEVLPVEAHDVRVDHVVTESGPRTGLRPAAVTPS